MNNFLILLILLFFSCTSSKSTNGQNSTLSLEEMKIGKNETAVLGKVSYDTIIDNKIIATLKVESMKQGGANALALVLGSDVDVVFTEIFQRSYQDRTGNTIQSELSDGRQILVSVKRNLSTSEYLVSNLKVN